MRYKIGIDTVSIQIDCRSKEEQQRINFIMSRAIVEYNRVYLKHNNSECEILSKGNKIGVIRSGTNPIYNKLKNQKETNYYIAVCFAGIKRYNNLLDILSLYCLLTIFGILNTINVNYKFTELDLYIDIDTLMQNVLALCTTKLSKTKYHSADKSFYNGDTVYIEEIAKDRLTYNSQRAYVYDKTKKEKLLFPITRFELKLQKPFFLSNDLSDSTVIAKALDRYTVMYFENSIEKNIIINKFNNHDRIRKRDIDKMGLNRYIIKPDVMKIWDFLKYLKDYKLY